MKSPLTINCGKYQLHPNLPHIFDLLRPYSSLKLLAIATAISVFFALSTDKSVSNLFEMFLV